MQLDPSDKFDRVLGVALEAEMQPGARKLTAQFDRGILTVDELIEGLERVRQTVRESTLWEHTE